MKTFFGGTFIEKEKLEEAGINHPIKLEYYKEINEEIFSIVIITVLLVTLITPILLNYSFKKNNNIEDCNEKERI